MAILTRLSTTVTSRYYPVPDSVDAFFLDGRPSGRREARSADVTTDKEEKSFLLSVFSHAPAVGWDASSTPAYEKPLQKLYEEVKSDRKSLDDQIGNLINTAVAVTGRMRLQNAQSRNPFFAGMIIKDGEAFAVTMGKGLAFLYRDDTLYPFTAADIPIEPINTTHQKVDSFYNYCAVKTATALCSNIAQLRMDDCLILCSQSVYDALGQREILRLLDDAYDQGDAAGTIITEAAAKAPGVPLQFLISFVESVTEVNAKAGLFNFKKKKKAKDETRDDEAYASSSDDSFEEEKTEEEDFDISSFLDDGEEELSLHLAGSGSEVDFPASHEEKEEEPDAFGSTMPSFIMPVTPSAVPESNASKVTSFSYTDENDMGKAKAETPEMEGMVNYLPATGEGEKLDIPFAFEDTEDLGRHVSPEEEAGLSADQDVTRVGITYVPETGEDQSAAFLISDEKPTLTEKPDGSSPPKPVEDEIHTAEVVQEAARTIDQGFSFVKESASDATIAAFGQNSPSGKDESASRSDFQEYGETNEDGFFIPFESAESAKPILSYTEDIPDMPIYDAPVSPPTYPEGSYHPAGYDDAGAYARGTYEAQDYQAQGVVKGENFSQQRPNPSGKRPEEEDEYSRGYTAYNYPIADEAPRGAGNRNYQPSGAGERTARTTGNTSRRGPEPDPRYRGNTDARREKSFDYGQPDSAYQRNRLVMIVLASLCTVCFVVLIILFASGIGGSGTTETTPGGNSLPSITATQIGNTTGISFASSPSTSTDGGTAQTEDPTGGSESEQEQVPGNPDEPTFDTFTFTENLGFRTWWDLFKRKYNTNLYDREDEATMISRLKEYNDLPADFVPTPDVTLRLPRLNYLTDDTSTPE